MSSKEYVHVVETFKRNKPHYHIVKRIVIKCVGGENLSKEKPQLVFVDQTEIPSLVRGRKSKNWKKLVNQIPEGKAVVVPEDYGSSATARENIKKINKKLGKETFKVTQRTNKNTDKITVYIVRL